MSSLGPRVGGAHVDVNLKFDDSSLDSLARRIHSQLQAIGDRNRKVYQSIGREAVTAWRGALGTILAGAPLIGSAMSAAAGAVTTLAGAVYSLGQSSLGALPFMTSLGLAGLTLSIGMNNFAAAVAETNPKGLQELLKGMPESMQKAVMSTRALSNEMRAAIWPKLFAGLNEGIDRLRNTGIVQKGLGSMADSMNFLAKSVLGYANSAEGTSTIDKFLQNNAKVFKALSKAVVPFLDSFLRLINALTPAALRLADRITDVGKRFQGLTKAEGYGQRINDMMKRAEKTAGLLLKVFGNLGSALANVFGAANPATNSFLETLVGVTQRFKDFTASADGQTSIATWAQNSVEVMKQVGETIRAVFDVISALADSRVIISFLKTLEGAFILLLELPLQKMVDSFVKIAEALQPISSAMLAVIIGAVSFNIIIGSITGQVAGLFTTLGSLKNIGDVFKGIGGSAGKHAAPIGKFTTLLKGIGTVVGKALKFAGIAGLAIYVVTLISKSQKLQDKLKEAFQAFKDLAGPIKEAFTEIKDSLTPVAKGLSPVFGFLDKIATLGIGLIIDTITFAFKSLGNVIKGAGRIISGLIDVVVGLFQLDGSKMLDGLKKIGSGIVPLLKGLLGLFVTFFAPARFLKIAGTAFKGLLGGIVRVAPTVLKGVAKFIGTLLKFFLTLPFKMLKFGGEAIVSLGKAIVKGTPGALSAAGKIVGGILKWIATLPGRLVLLGRHAITVLSDAIRKRAPKVLAAAGKIVTGVIQWIGRLPGRLVLLGRHAITVLSDAIRKRAPMVIDKARLIVNGIVDWIKKLPERLVLFARHAITRFSDNFRKGVALTKDIARRIFDTIVNKIKSLPGEMLAIGKNMIDELISGVTGKIKALKEAAGKVTDAIKGFFPGSPVKEGPLTAWNHGGGATGGGRNIIDAISGGLRNTDPIRRAMEDVSSAVAGSFVPSMAGVPQQARKANTEVATRTPDGSGNNVYIAKMMPHNYGEFERQTREKQRSAALGGRKP